MKVAMCVCNFVCVLLPSYPKVRNKNSIPPHFHPETENSYQRVFTNRANGFFQLPTHRPPPPRQLEYRTKICENLGHGTSCWCWWCNLFPTSSRLCVFAKKLSFRGFVFLFKTPFMHQFIAHTPHRNLKLDRFKWDHVFVISSILNDSGLPYVTSESEQICRAKHCQ